MNGNDKNINIDIKAQVDGAGFDAGVAQTERVSDAMKRAEYAAGQASREIKIAANETANFVARLERQNALFGKSATAALRYDASLLGMTRTQREHVDALLDTADANEKAALSSGNLKHAIQGVAAAIGLYKALDYIRDAATLAARYETMGITMKVAGNNAGYYAVEMEAYAKELQKNGISMMQSRDAVVQLATAHIDLTKAAAIGRAAQDLAVVGNVNSSEAMARMIYGIKSGQVEVLRTLGLNVSFEKSYQTLAAQLGVNADALTEQQKTMARTNAVLSESASYTGIYEESMTTAGKAMSSLARYSENLKIKLGEIFLPALADAVFDYTDALKAANTELDKAASEGTINRIGNVLGGAFRTVYETVVVLGANVGYVFATIGNEIGGIAAQVASVLGGDFAGAAQIRKDMIADAEAGRKAIDAFSERMLAHGAAAKKASQYNEEAAKKNAEAARLAAKAEEEAMVASEKTKDAREKRAKAIDDEAKHYAKLNESIGAHIAVLGAQEVSGERLTESQKKLIEYATNYKEGMTAQNEAAQQAYIASLARAAGLEMEAAAHERAEKRATAATAAHADVLAKLSGDFERNMEAQRRGMEVMPEAQRRLADELDKVSKRADEANHHATKYFTEGKLNAAEYGAVLADITVITARQRDEVQRLAADQERLNASWSHGAKSALQKYADEASRAASHVEDMFTRAFKGMEDALVGFVVHGKLDFGSLADSIISDMVRIQLQQSVTGPLAGYMAGYMGTIGTGWSVGAGGSFVGTNAEGVTITTVAGRLASGGDAAAGSLYQVNENGPELLEYGGKDYLMMGGEGGYVKPLSAPASMSGGGFVVKNNIQVINAPGTAAQVEQRPNNSGGMDFTIIIEQIEDGIARNVKRGTGALNGALTQTFGLNRAAGAMR